MQIERKDLKTVVKSKGKQNLNIWKTLCPWKESKCILGNNTKHVYK
jgi:hypothetical protein